MSLADIGTPSPEFLSMSKSKKKNQKSIPVRHRVTLGGKAEVAAAPVALAKKPEPYLPMKGELLVALVAMVLLTIWSYWPTLVWMESQWRTEPDYSHGYLILPLALVLLYRRMDLKPKNSPALDWGGLWLLVLAVVLRVVGRLAYMDFLDGWTLVPWVAGLVWLFCGRQNLWWSLPAIGFLLLLTPMPYKFESMLSFKLQGVSTLLSSAALVVMGFPAITEGNTIWLGDQHLMVEEACSGLRIFMGMVAMGYFFAVLSRRSWLDKAVILACCGPIAIVVNALRVTGTGIAYHWLSDEHAHQAHDWLGFLMIFVGAGMLFAVSLYWEALYKPVEVAAVSRRRLIES
jgi:exosortase